MTDLTLVFDAETLEQIARNVARHGEPWAIVNVATGDELQFVPDEPRAGLVTVTARQPDAG